MLSFNDVILWEQKGYTSNQGSLICYQLIVEGKSFLFSSKSLKLYLNSLGTTIKTGKKLIF